MTYDPKNPFARILRAEAPCLKICENEAVLVIMDLMPQSDGHMLVLPKEPASQIFELSDPSAEACIRAVRRVATAARAALSPDGVVVAQLNGKAAGQTIDHVHFHVIPRWAERPLRPHARVIAEQEKLEAIAAQIRAHLPGEPLC